jgi:metal-responsive CopG/Arc/MetJ family transcriptional regulator
MPARIKKVVTTSLLQDELAEFDRLRKRQRLTRAEAVREAIRWYIGVMRQLPPAEEPTPDELEAIRQGEEEFARQECRRLEDVLHDLGRPVE